MFANADGEFLAAFSGDQLGVAQAADAVVRLKNDCGSHHRTEKRSASDFIHSGNLLRPGGPREFFEFQGTAQAFQKTEFRRGRRESGLRSYRLGGHALASIFAQTHRGRKRGLWKNGRTYSTSRRRAALPLSARK